MNPSTFQPIKYIFALVCLTLITPSAAESIQPGGASFAITGASLIDGINAEPVTDAIVIIKEGIIECAGNRQSCVLESGTTTLNASGKWVTPGFIDSHIHWQIWYNGEGNLTEDMAQHAARVYLANGITTLVDVGGQRSVAGENRRILDDLQASAKPAPRMLFSGWIDRREIEASDSKDAGIVAAELLATDAAGIKIHNGLEPQDYELILTAANQAGKPVYGHTYYISENGFENFTTEAVSAGVKGIFHVLGIPPIAVGHEPPLPDAPMEDWSAWWLAGAELWLHATKDSMDELISLMVKRGAWLQPTLVTEQFQINPEFYQEHANWVYSPLNREDLMLGMPAFERQERKQYQAAYAQMQKFAKRFYEAGGILVAGTDGLPIPGFGLQEEMRFLVEAGIPAHAVIQTATRNAAMAWGWQDQIGTVEKGKVADLVILDGNPHLQIEQTANIWRTVKAGVVYDPQSLLHQ